MYLPVEMQPFAADGRRKCSNVSGPKDKKTHGKDSFKVYVIEWLEPLGQERGPNTWKVSFKATYCQPSPTLFYFHLLKQT